MIIVIMGRIQREFLVHLSSIKLANSLAYHIFLLDYRYYIKRMFELFKSWLNYL